MSTLVLGHWTGFMSMSLVFCGITSVLKANTITSMGLITHNKRFLHLTTDAPGSTHDARLLRYSTLFEGIQSGGGIPNKSIIFRRFWRNTSRNHWRYTFSPPTMAFEMLQ